MILLTIYKIMYLEKIDISVGVYRKWLAGCWSCEHKAPPPNPNQNQGLQMSLFHDNFDWLVYWREYFYTSLIVIKCLFSFYFITLSGVLFCDNNELNGCKWVYYRHFVYFFPTVSILNCENLKVKHRLIIKKCMFFS